MRFDEHFIRQTISQATIFGTLPLEVTFSIDSRTIIKTDFFIALPGERHDGHIFVIDALKQGARGAMIAADKHEECKEALVAHKLEDKVLIVVPDTHAALLSLAMRWREQFHCPIIGVTGSVGKTSTKESIAQLLETAGVPFIASYGNQNTQIGVALNLLRLRAHHKVGVFEMGINRRGEMALLAQLVKPSIGVITGIGHCHMEGLGSLQDIAAEKRDIFKYFTEKNIGIVEGDQPLLAGVSYPHPVIKCGLKTTNQIQARKVRIVDGQTRCVLKVYKEKYPVVLSKPHVGSVTTALVTAAVSHILSIPPHKMVTAIQKPIVVMGRFEQRVLRNGRGLMISDCYNANPESMKAALNAFQHIETSAEKIAVLGDMLELGVNSPFWHRQIGRYFRKVPTLKKVILVGDLVQWIEKTVPVGTQVERVQTWQEAEKILQKQTQEQIILVKGSLKMGLLNLVERCTK